MIKYYKELENRKNYCLPLIDNTLYNSRIIDCKLPISFYRKYQQLFIESKEILNTLKNIDKEQIILKYKIGIINYDDLDVLSFFDNIMNEESVFYYLENVNCISSFECDYFLKLLVNIINCLSIIYKEKSLYYKLLLSQYENAIEEIKNYNTINYDFEKRIDVKLNDTWYITSLNDLYNPCNDNENGHKETSLIYPFANAKDKIAKNESLDFIINILKKERQKIIEMKSISQMQFQQYLNYKYEIPTYMNMKKYYFDRETHIKSIVDIVKGVISAEISLYTFFDRLQKYTNKPKYELDRLLEMCNDDICDILTRCCNCHKIDSNTENTIVTSELFYEKEFSKYIDKEWNIQFIPPIIINKEKGVVEELDVTSPIVERYLENNKVLKLK